MKTIDDIYTLMLLCNHKSEKEQLIKHIQDDAIATAVWHIELLAKRESKYIQSMLAGLVKRIKKESEASARKDTATA